MFSYKKAKNVLALTAALTVLCSQSVFAATLELDAASASALTTILAVAVMLTISMM